MPDDVPASRRCPSEPADTGGRLLEPLLARRGRRGRPLKWPRRPMADAVLHLVRSGCAWCMLPRHSPPWPTVHSQFRRRRLGRTIKAARDRLRKRVREAEGRALEPSAAILGSQSVRTTGTSGPARGYGGGKKVKGRKRHLPVDVGGKVLLTHVHAANLRDRAGAGELVGSMETSELPEVRLTWGDQAYTGAFAERLAAERGWRQGARHPDRQLRRYGLEEKPKNASRAGGGSSKGRPLGWGGHGGSRAVTSARPARGRRNHASQRDAADRVAAPCKVSRLMTLHTVSNMRVTHDQQ